MTPLYAIARHLQHIVDREGGQKPAARVLGIDQSAVSQILTGRREPRLSTLLSMCAELGVSLDALVGREVEHARRQPQLGSYSPPPAWSMRGDDEALPRDIRTPTTVQPSRRPTEHR